MARTSIALAGTGGDDNHTVETRVKHMERKHLSRIIKLWMQENDANYSDLGRRAGLPRDSIQRYATMKSFPTEPNLRKMARAMHKTIDELAPNRAALYVAVMENPTVSMTVTPDRPGMAWLRIDQLTDVKTAQKIIDMLQDNEPHNRK